MKLRNIFTALIASMALMFVGCQEEERFLDEVKVSQSYVTIPAEGGQVEITVNTIDNWEITGIPEWLTVSPTTGTAGESKVTFSAGAATATNEALLYLNCAGASQAINVLQLTEKVELPISTCAEVVAGEDGVVYRVKGTVTSIANTTYGNWYLEDETGSVYIYGTLYEGAEKQFEKIGIEVGDIVIVEGPRKDYSGTIELVNVTVIDIEKSLIKVDEVSPEDALLPIEGGEFTVSLTCKGEGVSVVIPEDAKSWLTLSGVSLSGTTAVVKFVAAVNELGDRSTELVFITEKDGVEYKAVTSLSQTGSIIEATAAEINAAEDGETLYRLTGYISGDKGSEYGNIYIKDATGEVYVYGVLDAEGNSKQWFNMGIKQGDIVTVIAPKTSYNGAPQLKNATIEKHIPVTDKTVAEFLAAEESGDVYYRLTGAVSGLADAGIYGNIYVTDESGESVYVYGLLSGWGGPKKEFQTLVETTGLAEGDIITIVGVRSSYNDVPQVGSAFYVSHEPGEAPVPELSVDGKQWIAEMDGNQVLFDFGLAEETFLSIALPTMDGTGFGLYMAGLYDIEMTDAASGLVTFTQYDWEWDEFLEEMEIQYSELGETSVKFVCESVFGVSDPVVFTLVEEPYEIEAPDMGESPEGAVEDGDYWIIEPTAAVAMAPLAGNYGYPEAGYVLAENGTYASTLENAYTFTYLPDKSYYTIQDSNGKYLYMKTKDDGSWYTSFNVGEYEDNSKYHWVVFDQGDGTYDIYNVASEYQIAYSSAYNSWGAYAWGSGNALPMLVKAENPVEEPEVEIPEGTTVIAMGTDNQTWTEAEHETYGTGYIATVGDYTVAYYQNTSSTAPSQGLQADHIRVYVGSNLVVTNTAGKKIKSLAITCAGGKTGPISVEGVEYSATDNVITWEGETEVFDANCIKQTRVASLTIIAE